MPISGLVLTFEREANSHDEALTALRNEPAIEVGVQEGGKLAIVVSSNSKEHDQEIWQWVHELPGVASVDVAFVGFDDEG